MRAFWGLTQTKVIVGRPPVGAVGVLIGCGLVALGDAAPIDDVPPALDVRGPPVLVLEVVGVLPDVDAEQRRQAGHQRRVLVGRRRDGQTCPVMDQPRPPAAKTPGCGRGHLTLELVDGSKGRLDRIVERTSRFAASIGSHDLSQKSA